MMSGSVQWRQAVALSTAVVATCALGLGAWAIAAAPPQGDGNAAAPCAEASARCTWERVFGSPVDDKAQAAARYPDGDFAVIGNTRPRAGRSYDSWIARVARNGDMLWQRRLSAAAPARLSDIAAAPDGGFLAVGKTIADEGGRGDLWALRLSAAGERLGETVLGGAAEDRATAVTALPGGGFAAAGFTESRGAGDRDLWLVRLDDSGAVIGEETFGGPGDDGAMDIAALSDGGLAIAGHRWDDEATGYDAWILRLDAAGEVLWERRFDGARFEGATVVTELAGGDLAIGGMVGGKRLGAEDLWIARLGPDGATRWFRRLDTPRHQSPWGLAAAPGGDVLVAAVRWFEADDAGDLSLLRLTPAGETRWERRFGGRYWDRPTGILAVGDGMLVVGHTSSTGSGYEDAWLLRLDGGGKL